MALLWYSVGVASLLLLPRRVMPYAFGLVAIALAYTAGHRSGVENRPLSQVILNAAARARSEAMNG